MTLKKFLRNTLAIAMIALFVCVVLFRFVLGGSIHFIATGSMVPTLSVHTLVFDLPSKEFKVGDIVTLQQPGMPEPISHRLVGINANGSIVTKGDANPSPDNPDVPFTKADIMGKVLFQLPVTSSSFWLSLPGIITGLIGLLYLLYAFGPSIKRGDDEDAQSDKKARELAHT